MSEKGIEKNRIAADISWRNLLIIALITVAGSKLVTYFNPPRWIGEYCPIGKTCGLADQDTRYIVQTGISIHEKAQADECPEKINVDIANWSVGPYKTSNPPDIQQLILVRCNPS